MAPKLKKRSPPGQRASEWDSNWRMKALFSPHIAKTSDQHLLIQRFAPMQNFHALAQPASPEEVSLHLLMDTFFGLGLHDPQATFGHLPKLLAQTARHTHLRLMCSHPINVGLQMGGTQSALIGSVGE
jgi:phytoene dehydrogenase-like protein